MKMQTSCGTGRPEKMENQSEQILLDVQNLHTCFYGRRDMVHAVNGVSFKVSAGEILGIVGESRLREKCNLPLCYPSSSKGRRDYRRND